MIQSLYEHLSLFKLEFCIKNNSLGNVEVKDVRMLWSISVCVCVCVRVCVRVHACVRVCLGITMYLVLVYLSAISLFSLY